MFVPIHMLIEHDPLPVRDVVKPAHVVYVPMPACVGDVIVVAYGEPVGCDVSPPQRLDVTVPVAVGADAARAMADDMGAADVIWSPDSPDVFTFEGVDY